MQNKMELHQLNISLQKYQWLKPFSAHILFIHIYAYIYFAFSKQPHNTFLSVEGGGHVFNIDKAARLKIDHMYTIISLCKMKT